MSSVVNNLKVNNDEVKGVTFNSEVVKEVWFNNVLIWKNANPFVFLQNKESLNPADYPEDTLIFIGFSEKDFEGSYNVVENAEEEKKNLQEGQMVVEETTDGEKQ